MKQIKTKTGGTLADIEAVQKMERLRATDQTIREISPMATDPATDLQEGGERAIQSFTDNYNQTQEALKPILEQIKQYETVQPFGQQAGVIKAMADRVPGISRMFNQTKNNIEINPYSSAWGIDKNTYNAVDQAVKALDQPAFIQELMNVRQGLEQNIDVQQGGNAAAQIRQLKAGMMDYIQKQIEKVDPRLPAKDDAARNVLRDWAINEGQREIIENEFGASVGSKEFSQMSKVSPEKVLDKIFSNTANVKAAKSIMSPAQFKQMTADYLNAQRQAMTKDGNFSSNKFYSFLTKRRFAIGEAMSDPKAAMQLQRINDLNTTMRNFPDIGAVNNSKTVTGMQMLLNKAGSMGRDLVNGDVGNVISEAKEHILGKMQNNAKRKALDAALQGKPEILNKLSAVKSMSDKVDESIQNGIKAISSSANRKKKGGGE